LSTLINSQEVSLAKSWQPTPGLTGTMGPYGGALQERMRGQAGESAAGEGGGRTVRQDAFVVDAEREGQGQFPRRVSRRSGHRFAGKDTRKRLEAPLSQGHLDGKVGRP
jgi:hypothetical protein